MAYWYLMVAIVTEVAGTTFFRLSEGFAKWHWGLVAMGLYLLSLLLLSWAMKTIPMTITQPLWAGVGTALVALIGVMCFGERLAAGQWVGLVLTITGAVMLRVLATQEVGT